MSELVVDFSEDFAYKLCDTTIQVIEKFSESVSEQHFDIFAWGNTSGFFSLANDKRLIIDKISKLSNCLEESESTFKTTNSISLGNIQHIKFNCDESKLLIVQESKIVYIEKDDFNSLSLPELNNIGDLGSNVISVQPSPQDPSKFLILTETNKLYLLDLSQQFNNSNSWHDDVSSFSWSDEDDLISIGIKSSNEIKIISIDRDVKATITNEASDSDSFPIYIKSISPSIWFVVYCQDYNLGGEHEPRNFLIKSISNSYEFYECPDIAPAFSSIPRQASYYINILESWCDDKKFNKLVIVSSGSSTEITTLTESAVIKHERDTDIAELPLDDDNEDSSSLGAALDLCATEKVLEPCLGVDECGPLPRVWVYTRDGTLTCWNIIYSVAIKDNSVDLDKAKEALKPTRTLKGFGNAISKSGDSDSLFSNLSISKKEPPLSSQKPHIFGQPSEPVSNPFANPGANPFANPNRESSPFGKPTGAFGNAFSNSMSSNSSSFESKPSVFGGQGLSSENLKPASSAFGNVQPATSAFASTAFGSSTFGQPGTSSAFGLHSDSSKYLNEGPVSFGTGTGSAANTGAISFGKSAFGSSSGNGTVAFGKSAFGSQAGFGSSGFGQFPSTAAKSGGFGSFGGSDGFGNITNNTNKSGLFGGDGAKESSPFSQLANSGSNNASPFSDLGKSKLGESPFATNFKSAANIFETKPPQIEMLDDEDDNLPSPFGSYTPRANNEDAKEEVRQQPSDTPVVLTGKSGSSNYNSDSEATEDTADVEDSEFGEDYENIENDEVPHADTQYDLTNESLESPNEPFEDSESVSFEDEEEHDYTHNDGDLNDSIDQILDESDVNEVEEVNNESEVEDYENAAHSISGEIYESDKFLDEERSSNFPKKSDSTIQTISTPTVSVSLQTEGPKRTAVAIQTTTPETRTSCIQTFEDEELYLSQYSIPPNVPQYLELANVNYPPLNTNQFMAKIEQLFYDTDSHINILLENTKNIGTFIDENSSDELKHTEKTLINPSHWRLSEINTIEKFIKDTEIEITSLLSSLKLNEGKALQSKNSLAGSDQQRTRIQSLITQLQSIGMESVKKRPLSFNNEKLRKSLRLKSNQVEESISEFESALILLKSKTKITHNGLPSLKNLEMAISSVSQMIRSKLKDIEELSTTIDDSRPSSTRSNNALVLSNDPLEESLARLKINQLNNKISSKFVIGEALRNRNSFIRRNAVLGYNQ